MASLPKTTPADQAKPAALTSGSVSRQVNKLTGVQVLATGRAAPERVVHNEELAEHGYDADWIVQRTGIQSRHCAGPEEATSDMATRAALRCLEAAELDPMDVDLILVSTITPDQPTPSTACHVQRAIGSNAPAMDISAACAGFMYAMVTGMQFVHNGTYRHVLVIGADMMSRTVNPEDKKTFPLFGDGAGAILLGAGNEDQGMLAYTLGADGVGAELLQIPAGGTRKPITLEMLQENENFLVMDGRAVFKWAVRTLAESTRQVLDSTGHSIEDVQIALFHQANIRILDAAVEHLGIDSEKVPSNLDRYGNTSSASIPLVLDEVCREGRIDRGDLVLMSGFGAGLAWGTALIRW
ncbi:MAG: beta-ketoacyl-ACP synthase III [Pirellulaceae bacterium]|nr:beta-ketoacyl-ACP synthase III [Pirellulaceae bacterium]